MFEYLYSLIYGEVDENIKWCPLQQHKKYVVTMNIKVNNIKNKRALKILPSIMNFTIKEQLDKLDFITKMANLENSLEFNNESFVKFDNNDGYVSL
tara:strand:+ start:354 stop:641 length:288 start_codon:yes stop_codon:yes gene_type:complete